MKRGEIWWALLPDPRGSEPGYKRPVLVVQSDFFNRSAIQTVIVAVITSNLKLSSAPANVMIRAHESGLKKDSVANLSQIITLDKRFLLERSGRLQPSRMVEIDEGLQRVLALGSSRGRATSV